MSTTAPTIPAETARHVLWHYGQADGWQPGSFTQRLMEAMDAADMTNLAKLAGAFPDYAAAIVAAKLDPDGIAHLQRIAAGAECPGCGDTDGPWEDGICEGCLKTVPAGGAA